MNPKPGLKRMNRSHTTPAHLLLPPPPDHRVPLPLLSLSFVPLSLSLIVALRMWKDKHLDALPPLRVDQVDARVEQPGALPGTRRGARADQWMERVRAGGAKVRHGAAVLCLCCCWRGRRRARGGWGGRCGCSCGWRAGVGHGCLLRPVVSGRGVREKCYDSCIEGVSKFSWPTFLCAASRADPKMWIVVRRLRASPK